MSSHIVDHDHDELENVGTATHNELELVLQGVIPTTLDFSLGIALLPEDNNFSGTNSFETINVNNLNVVTQNQVNVNNINIESSVMALGQGTSGELPPADRGLIFMDTGLNPCIFWDQSQAEFRFGRLDVDTSVTEFPDPDDAGQAGYSNIKVGNISGENVDIADLSVDNISVLGAVQTPELKVDSLKTTSGLNYLQENIGAGSGLQISIDPSNADRIIISKPSRVKETMYVQNKKSAGSPVVIPGAENIHQFDSRQVDVYINGVMVAEGSELDYTITSNGIIFSFDLELSDIVTVSIN